MKFHFEDQPHQAAAIAAVTDLFEGVLSGAGGTTPTQVVGSDGHAAFTLHSPGLLANLELVTKREKVELQTSIALLNESDLQGQVRSFPNFSVEMETGTGKTYVLIATALRLAELYGLRKFVILVHSVAIRAGTEKTLEQTAEHFAAKYPSLSYRWGTLGEGPALDDFIEPSNSVQFLIVSVQAIDKPVSNSIYQVAEQPQLWNQTESGINGISTTRPVVIIDEPQNMATELRRKAIATLNPIFALRYSATHREPFNIVHRLSAKAASEAGLVKRVSVKGVVAGDSGMPYLLVSKIRSVKKRLMAEVEIDQMRGSGAIERVETVLQNGSDLFEESNGVEHYRGLIVDRFERKPDRVIFENGLEVAVGTEIGTDKASVWRDQIRFTIRQHLARQAQADSSGRSIKVLSLFFIERVGDYVGGDAILPKVFDQVFREEWIHAGLDETECPDPAILRTAYFASTKTGIIKDTSGRASDAEDEARAYEEIITKKELLLVKSNPRAFIFSHSALREGWDNPNVFQVCFLRHTRSDLERRQQIGRGLRIPVDEQGHRVMDPAISRLTLVVDESFAAFRDGLNNEYGRAGGGDEAPPPPEDADDEIFVRRRPERFESTDFAELWKRIRYKARYRINIEPTSLPATVAASEILDGVAYLARRANIVQGADLEYDNRGRVITKDSAVVESKGELISIVGQRLPNLATLVENHLLTTKYPLQLTRNTIGKILAALPAKVTRRALDDPEGWARIVASAIRTVTIEEIVQQIIYDPLPETEWWNAEVVFSETEVLTVAPVSIGDVPSRGAVAAIPGGMNLYDHTIYDSNVELNFSKLLDHDPTSVPLFTKLPRRFRVRTPVGDYSPDWAVVYNEGGKSRLYLVRETKDTLKLCDLEWDEAMRIRFANKHFSAAPSGAVHYVNTTDVAGLRLLGDLE